jgi:outer membrane protein TolC
MRKASVTLTIILFLSVSWISAKAEEALTWQDCLKEAAKNHPDLIAAEEVVKQSEASKKITASALYPQINANLNASTAKTASSGSGSSSSGPSGTGSSTSDSYSYGLTGTQLIFDGIKTINNVNAAGENIKASKQNFRFTSATVRFRLRSAFVNLLTAQESLRIAEDIYAIRRGNLELITLRYESGLEHRGALLTAEADLAAADYGVAQAKRSIEVGQGQLTKELGRSQLLPIRANGDFQVLDTAKERPDFGALAKDNPSLQQIIAQKNAAMFGVRAAYANFSPTLSGQAGANQSDNHWSPNKDQWNLGLTLSMPIFEGGLRIAQVAQAKALLYQLQENERSSRDGIIFTLEQAWAALQNAMDNVGVQEKNLIATTERSKIAQAQYSTGFISFDNWTIIEDNLVKAKKAFLDVQSGALLAEANWIQAKGETLEYE